MDDKDEKAAKPTANLPPPKDFRDVDDAMGTDMDEPTAILRELIRRHQEAKAKGQPTGWENV